ncbi:hypothetical protein SMC26_18405 [Actinomadura fulvescens]
MSVDVVAELPRPVSLASVMGCAAGALTELLGLDRAPEMTVFEGWRTENDSKAPPRRSLTGEDLEATMIGVRIPPEEGQTAGSVEFEIGLAGKEDRAFAMVIDLTGVQGAEPRVEAVVSPTRTCVGVVLATSVALGAATVSGGAFVDIEIAMLDARDWDPGRFIEAARLTGGAGPFEERCERFMRQFAGLGGWPRDRSAN